MRNPVLLLIVLAIAHSGITHADDHHRVAFVTSVSGSGDLSTWPDADNESGLAAGDAICQARASAAGLSNPENFVAWLSDSSDDAYCRLHGLTGKKADNCGQAELPAAAGPWMRTDGFPFSVDIGGLAANAPVIFTPLQFNEYGAQVVSAIATGTQAEGDAGTGHCNDWSVGANDGETRVTQGTTLRLGRHWTNLSSSISCHIDRPLACFEREAGPELPPFEQEGRIVFITSVSGPGDLSAWPQAQSGTTGIEAGDSICRNLASNVGLPEPEAFKAWLSDATIDAIERFENDGGWVRIDGIPVAANKADLTEGLLFTAISVTEEGQYLRVGLATDRAWTGTTPDGHRSNDHCNSWVEDTDTEVGRFGVPSSTDSIWTEWSVSGACDASRRLYCLSDAVDHVIFTDRFE